MWENLIMNQVTKLYWPQHKVFFVATLVLFPDRLTTQPLDPWFFRPYFNFAYSNNFDEGLNKEDPGLGWVATMLDEYKKAGYIEYEKENSLFKITIVDTKKAKKDLKDYLKHWQLNGLHALSATKPPDASRQREMLLSAIIRDYLEHKDVQRITLEDVYGSSDKYTYRPPFWELVLSYQLLDKKVKIVSMDYGRRDDGLYDDGSQPAIDIKIVDNELASIVEQRAALLLRSPMEKESKSSALTMTTEGIVYVNFANKKYLIKKVRRDSAPYNFLDYMLGHQNQDISRGVIQTKVEGCAGKNDMTMLASRCGFTKELLPLKAVYFGGTTKTIAHFRATAELTAHHISLLVSREIT